MATMTTEPLPTVGPFLSVEINNGCSTPSPKKRKLDDGCRGPEQREIKFAKLKPMGPMPFLDLEGRDGNVSADNIDTIYD